MPAKLPEIKECYDGNASSNSRQVVSQVDRVDRGDNHEVDKMVEDAVGI